MTKMSFARGAAPLLGAPATAMEAAREAATSLARHPDVAGVAVFGSVARGRANESSDTDLLVLLAREGAERRDLLRWLPDRLRSRGFTLLCYADDDLASLMRAGTSFSEHLRREAKVLADRAGVLTELLATPATSPVSVREELAAELAQLNVYSDLDVFRDNFLFVLARLYGVAKAIVMLGLVADAAPTFDREEAFREFRRRHPEVADRVEEIQRLRPFYLYVTRRSEVTFPFPYRGCREEVVSAMAAVRAIAAAVA